jgi:two-component system phosphate regulon response regulator OmpR
MNSPKPTLLIVDDEAELRALLVEYLGGQGFVVLQACDAAQARATLAQRSSPPDLTLLDVNMPGENGFSLARWLRERHPRMGVVMLTTASDTVDRVVGLEIGADDYVAKPFELRELLARVRVVLRRATLSGPGASAPDEKATPSAPIGVADQADAPGSWAAVGAPTEPAERVAFGHCLLDLAQRRLFDAGGQALALTAAEFDLLALFAPPTDR